MGLKYSFIFTLFHLIFNPQNAFSGLLLFNLHKKTNLNNIIMPVKRF